MSMLAQAARGIKNMWSQGDEDEEDYDSSDTPETTAPSKYTSDKYSSDKYSEGKTPADKYTSDFGGNGGSSNRSKPLRSVPIPLRAREKNIYTLRPKNQDEAAIAADYLKSGSAVVMNLETVEKAVAIRIIDFMSGVCYGLEGQGHAMKLGDSIFLFTPAEFEISSDELDYGENRDFFFKDVDKPIAPASQNHPLQQQATRAAQPGAAALQPNVASGGQSPNTGTMTPPPASHPQGSISSSGYATADYTPPHAPSAISAAAATAPEPVSVPTVQSSTLPASSVYGSSGKAHVLIGGKPASVNPAVSGSPRSASSGPGASGPASSNTQGSYQSSERRSWER